LVLLLLVLREEDAAAAERGPSLRHVELGLGLDFWVVDSGFGEDFVD
jgi:hypothetical protein